MGDKQDREGPVVPALLRRLGFDEFDQERIADLAAMALPRSAERAAFLLEPLARQQRTYTLAAMIIGAICAATPVVLWLAGVPGNFSRWFLTVLGVAMFVTGVVWRVARDPRRQAQHLLTRGMFVEGRIVGTLGGLAMAQEQHLTIAYQVPSGASFGLGVQNKRLPRSFGVGDPVLVICSTEPSEIAGVVTPGELLTLGRAYPTDAPAP